MMNESDALAWAPSIRALCASNSYEEYLALMKQYEDEVNDKIDQVFTEGG